MRDTAILRRPPRRRAVLVRAVGCGLVLLPLSAEAAAAPDATVRKLQQELEELRQQLEEHCRGHHCDRPRRLFTSL